MLLPNGRKGQERRLEGASAALPWMTMVASTG
jgi:hypothetical protein